MWFEYAFIIIFCVLFYSLIGTVIGLLAVLVVHNVDLNDDDDMAFYIIGWPVTIFIILGYALAKLVQKIVK